MIRPPPIGSQELHSKFNLSYRTHRALHSCNQPGYTVRALLEFSAKQRLAWREEVDGRYGVTRLRTKPSSTQVARLAGVSQSAVSRTYTPGASVSEPTRRKVMEAAEKLGYLRQPLPAFAVDCQPNLIGVVMGEVTNPFYPEVLELLLDQLEAAGYRILLKHCNGAHMADEAVKEVLKYKVRGAIITSAIISTELAQHCGQAEIPVVLFNRHIKDANVTSVCCDNVDAGRLVANLLLDNGFKNPVFISGNERANTNADRQKGFLDRLSERGVWNVPTLGGENTHDVGFEAARELIGSGKSVDAIFCASDILAFGVIDYLKGAGIRIPEDMSVIGFDDVPMAAWPIFSLTTIRQRRSEMVKAAVDSLVQRISGVAVPSVRLLPVELILRGSARVVGASQ